MNRPLRIHEQTTRLVLLGFATVVLSVAGVRADEERRNWYNDPFVQATQGYPHCPPAQGPLLTREEMREQAHQRVERGTSCWLEGKCEPGGPYLHDQEINERVRRVVAGDSRFRRTTLWLTTQAAFVTLEGCVRSRAQQHHLITLIGAQRGVRYVDDRTTVGLPARRSQSSHHE